MATRKEARQRAVLQVSALAVVTTIIVAVIVLGVTWFNNRPAPHPSEVAITVSNGEESIEVFPYQICELGTECGEGGEIPVIDAAPGDTLTIELDESIYDHDWSLLSIYDNPGANDQQMHGPHDASSAEVPVSVAPVAGSDEEPQLVVVEVNSAMLGTDEEGNETVYATVWSVATQSPSGQ